MSIYAEIFQLHLESTQEDLDRCITKLQINFNNKSFKSISLIIKKEKTDTHFAT